MLITWLNGKIGMSSVNLGSISLPLALKLFFIGMIAISAMFLPGISGSTILLILGMMIGSFYAIVMGPTTLEIAQPALSFQNFNIIAAVIGLGLVLGMHALKEWSEGYEH